MTQARKALGDTIKTSGNNRIGGYLVCYTHADDPDLQGEYFTRATNFWFNEYPIKGKPVLIDHAFDEKFKSIPVGILDFVKENEVGIWVEAKLHERDEYERMLLEWRDRKFIDLPDNEIKQLASNIEKAVKGFFDTGKVQWSSGALPQSVEVAEDGHVTSWAIIEGTGVMTPAEPDGTEISSIKSALDQLSNILNSIHPAQTEAQKDGTDRDSAQGDDADNVEIGESKRISNDNTPTNKDTEMEF